MSAGRLYGLLASFDTADALLEAARLVSDAGYRRLDAFTPFPVEGLAEAIGFRGGKVRWLVLLGALLGGLLGYFIQYYSAVVDYPLNVGGKPLHSWPAFMLVTFELTILGGAFGAVLGMLALNGLPRLHHPLFNTPGFGLATRDRFFLLVDARDPRFDPENTRDLLEALGPLRVEDVER